MNLTFKVKFLLFSLCLFIKTVGQTGSIKIFSEIKNYSVYLDDSLIGKELKKIDSIKTGTRYIKVKIRDIIVYNELVSVYKDSTTVVLLKYTIEAKAAELTGMSDEIKEYKKSYLRVKEKTVYATNGSSRTNNYSSTSIFLPDSETNTSSVSTPIEDWSVVDASEKKISVLEFAQLINDTAAVNAIIKYTDEVDSDNRSKAGLKVVGFMAIIGGGIFGLTQVKNDKPIVIPILISGSGLGLVLAGSGRTKFNKAFYTPNQMIDKVIDYNLNLKKKLNLPLDYEPIVDSKI
jgi:hypothetical protein